MNLRTAIAFCLVLGPAVYAQGDLQTRNRSNFNGGWRFFKGTPKGAPWTTVYDDSKWVPVNLPHSASYDDPEEDRDNFVGDCWYRKSFRLPAMSGKKVFFHFEGAMQTAAVWVNGVRIGLHDNSGYTGFQFDVTGKVFFGASNVMAVKLDNRNSNDIPPGRTGVFSGDGHSAPDFYLYSGIYRDVWLILTQPVHVDFCGQTISTPAVSASSATVKVGTTVKNDAATAQDCIVTVSLRDSSGVEFQNKSVSISVAPHKTAVAQITSDPIADPHLWSPKDPCLYRAYTQVKVKGTVVDDYAETFGIRSMSWDNKGFHLNGERVQINGVCMHQTFAWIGNALPRSRYEAEVKMAQSMGANAIRCSHYPRDPDFYDACDRLGMLLIVELPTWGGGANPGPYSSAFWTRLAGCAVEMVREGINHPSIISWSIFNEPGQSFPDEYRPIAAVIRKLDPSRALSIALNGPDPSVMAFLDVWGLNSGRIDVSAAPPSWPAMMTEYYSYERGLPRILAQAPRLAGGFAWCFADYNSHCWYGYHMGIVTANRIPKTRYFKMKEILTGQSQAAEIPAGGKPTRIELSADVTPLVADGTDVSRILATLRDDAGQCISATMDVTFSVTGPATLFGRTTLPTEYLWNNPPYQPPEQGRAAIILKTTTTPGEIVVTASAAGLPPASVTLTSAAQD